MGLAEKQKQWHISILFRVNNYYNKLLSITQMCGRMGNINWTDPEGYPQIGFILDP